MQQEILLIGVKLDELLTKFDSLLEKRLSKIPYFGEQDDPSTKYLSRKEVAKLLRISLPTLHEWTKISLLKSYRIGNRVLYKQAEVEKALIQTSQIKYKKYKP